MLQKQKTCEKNGVFPVSIRLFSRRKNNICNAYLDDTHSGLVMLSKHAFVYYFILEEEGKIIFCSVLYSFSTRCVHDPNNT